MKQSILLSITLTIFTISCNNHSQHTDQKVIPVDSSKAIENKIMIPVSSCYASWLNKDTVRLKVEVFEHVITGMLSYHFHEKDSNNGDFEGQFKGDTLVADYSFISEGIRSVRQVVFLIKDSTATEGYGEMEEKNGKMIFKNLNEVIFGKGIILQKVECNY